MRTRSLGLCAATLIALGVAGCGGVQPDSVGATPSTTAGATDTTAPATPTETGQATSSAPAHTGFGAPIQWEDMNLTVSEPRPFNPSSFAAYPQGSERFVEMDVTLENTSDQPLETMFFAVFPGSGDLTDKVADSDKDIGTPTTAIAPGQSLTWKEAYPMNEAPLTLYPKWAPPGGQEQSTTLTLNAYPTPTATATGTGTDAAGTATATDAPAESTTSEASPATVQ